MSTQPLVYPHTATVDHVDDYHGTKVADPYRWLEDLDSEETRRWVEAQNAVTFEYLAKIPERDKIRKRLNALWDHEKFGIPWKRQSRYFYMHNTGLQNQSVLYALESLEGEPRILLDPNTLSEDGTVALTGATVSEDGKHLAYGLSASGSDWQEWRVRDVDTGQDLTDHLKWVKFSGASWTKDGAGFFYSRYDEPTGESKLEDINYYQKLFYHALGTDQSEDVLIYERPDHKDWGFGGGVSEDGRYLLIGVWQGTEPKNAMFYKDLSDLNAPVVELLNDFDASYSFIGNEGPVFWFQTDLDAPRGRLIAIDTTKPDPTNWVEIIPQTEHALQSIGLVGERFFLHYLKDASSQIKIFDLGGIASSELQLPGLGTAGGFGGRREDTETFYVFTNSITPPAIFRYEIETNQSTLFRAPEVDFKSASYETTQVFYESKDGTRVPMFITHKTGVVLGGQNPTYLYGYGGFNNSMVPAFSIGIAQWLEMGGVFAQACLRGGGEYGEEWHEAGRRLKRQNVFDDFIAAAEFLIENRYTSTPKLAIGGGSNGGLLVGACMTQRPDLYGACMPAVGVLDMLRFHKFTIGWGWVSDYGSPDDPEEFKAIYAYSPLHNLKAGTSYPPTLITTGDHDDRVVPAHSFKFASALQAAHAGDAPVLARIEVKAGHGMGKSTQKVIEEASDRWAFLVKNLEMQLPEGYG